MNKPNSLYCIFLILALLTAQVGSAYAFGTMTMQGMTPMHSQTDMQTMSGSSAHTDCDMQRSIEKPIGKLTEISKSKYSPSHGCCDEADGLTCCEMDCHCVAFSGSMIFLENSNIQKCTLAGCALVIKHEDNLSPSYSSLPKRPPIATFS